MIHEMSFSGGVDEESSRKPPSKPPRDPRKEETEIVTLCSLYVIKSTRTINAMQCNAINHRQVRVLEFLVGHERLLYNDTSIVSGSNDSRIVPLQSNHVPQPISELPHRPVPPCP